jgi:hypothetical protein
MSMLEQIVSDPATKAKVEDFVKRVEQGPATEGFSHEEAKRQHDQVAAHATPADYEQAARKAFDRFAPEELKQLAAKLTAGAKANNLTAPQAASTNGGNASPAGLAQVASELHRQRPGIVGKLLSESDSPIAKAALGGIAAMVPKQLIHKQ